MSENEADEYAKVQWWKFNDQKTQQFCVCNLIYFIFCDQQKKSVKYLR